MKSLISKKFSVINIFIIIFLLSFHCCSEKSSKNSNKVKVDTTNEVVSDTIFLLNKDSLYVDLINKVNNDSIYIPVIRFIVNGFNSSNIQFANDTLFSDYLALENFINQPLKQLKKIKINNNTLVIAHFTYPEELSYFILNQKKEVTDHISFSGYREIVSSRKIYDWNKDGKDELVEIRENHGQMWEASTDAVYSIENDSLKLIFACTTREINCMTTGPHGEGGFVTRKYKYKGNGIYLISETEGYNDCNKYHFAPMKTLKWNEYKMSTDELVKEFGGKYNR